MGVVPVMAFSAIQSQPAPGVMVKLTPPLGLALATEKNCGPVVLLPTRYAKESRGGVSESVAACVTARLTCTTCGLLDAAGALAVIAQGWVFGPRPVWVEDARRLS